MFAVGFPLIKSVFKESSFSRQNGFIKQRENQTDTRTAHSLEKPKNSAADRWRNVQLLPSSNSMISSATPILTFLVSHKSARFLYVHGDKRSSAHHYECPKAKIAFKFWNLKIHTHTAIYSFASILIHYRTKSFCNEMLF